jgi:hypothetical protein
MTSYFDYILSRCTQGSFSFLPKARQTRGDARIRSQQVRSVHPVPT